MDPCVGGRLAHRRSRFAALSIAVSILAVACASGGSPANSPAGSSGVTSLTYVALGDSWPEGAHCDGCRTFAGLYADGLDALTRAEVEFVDRTGQAQPFFDSGGGGSASLLQALQSDSGLRDVVAAGDILMVATGPNEMGVAYESYKAGTCGGSDHMACFDTLGQLWRRNFDAILQEFEQLRSGKPTAIRLVSAANVFVSEPSLGEGLEENFATTKGALIFELLNEALCDAAAKHHAVCVDVRPLLNGPMLDEPVDENSPAAMQAVADALLATGLPELPP